MADFLSVDALPMTLSRFSSRTELVSVCTPIYKIIILEVLENLWICYLLIMAVEFCAYPA